MNETKQLSVGLLQGIVNYLVTKPYSEVAQFLSEIQKEISIVPKKEDLKKDEGFVAEVKGGKITDKK